MALHTWENPQPRAILHSSGEREGHRPGRQGTGRERDSGCRVLSDPCQATPYTVAPSALLLLLLWEVTRVPGDRGCPLSPEAPPPQGTLESQPRSCPSPMRALEEPGTQDVAFSGNIPPQHWIPSFSALDPPVRSKHIPTCSKNRISETKIPPCFYISLFQWLPRRPEPQAVRGVLRSVTGTV